MNRAYKAFLAIVNSLFISLDIFGQNESEGIANEGLLEALMNGIETSDTNLALPVEDLVDKSRTKLDLNRVTEAQLTSLFILSPQQVKAILDYRNKIGVFNSVYELQFIYQLDRKTLELLIPFVSVHKLSTMHDDKSKTRRLYIKQELSTRIDYPLYKKKGYDKAYLGNPVYNNMRYTCKVNKSVEFGFVAEKDAGEPLFALDNHLGYDYYSYYLLLKNINIFKSICIGKYRLNLAQGLVMGSPQFGGKWSQIQSFFNSSIQLNKHSSISEYNYLRGVAFHLKFKRFSILPFYSNVRSDGKINSGEIVSFTKTGLHRTAKEFQAKHKISENLIGVRMAYGCSKFLLGFSVVLYKFNYPISPSKLLYKRDDINGNSFYNISFDYNYYFKDFMLKGELAKGVQGIASLQKLYYSPSSDFDFLLIHRYYTKDYWAYHAKAFGNQSLVKNEHGWYLNFQTTILQPLLINTYLDYCIYSSPRYQVSRPSKSFNTGVALEYDLNRSNEISFKCSFLSTIRDRSGSKGKVSIPYQQTKLHLEYKTHLMNAHLLCKTFCDCSILHADQKEMGYQLSERVTYLFWKMKLAIQYSFIQGSSFDNRLYIYEPSLLYNSYMPSYYGKGHKCSAILNYSVTKNLNFTIKYGVLSYLDRSVIGSGNEEINDSMKADLQFMGRIKF